MNAKNIKTIILLTLCHLVTPCFATNFNDGINGDGPIQDEIEPDINKQYISQKTIAAIRTGKRKVFSIDENGAGIGNIIIGPNTDLKGAIIINNSRNRDTAIISK